MYVYILCERDLFETCESIVLVSREFDEVEKEALEFYNSSLERVKNELEFWKNSKKDSSIYRDPNIERLTYIVNNSKKTLDGHKIQDCTMWNWTCGDKYAIIYRYDI